MGAADGYDAVVQWRWEHMPWGATCYLDTTVLGRRVAPIHVPAEWLDYYKGWVGAVLDSGALHPGTCCAKSDEPEVAEALRAVYRERRRALRKASLWTVLADSGPPARGQARCQAEVWQSGAGAIQQSYGGVSLAVSPCWAATPDPSFDERPATDPASLEAMLRPGVAAGVTAAIPSGLATDVRALMEACLSSLALANTSAASLFPYGIDDLEMQITERDGAAHAQVRVSAAKTSNRERVE
jgi:hypothetical protein